jgi:hypothetical protein
MSLNELLQKMEQRLNAIEGKFSEMGYTQQRLVETEFKRKYKVEQQVQTLSAPIIAYCVDTIDPLKLNRIRFFSPFLHEPNSRIRELPFARAVANFGGHDDCGNTWVPPAGATVVIIHENGDRKSPLYIGSTFHGDRGPDGSDYPYPIVEFQRLYCDRGEGYLVGNVDGSQVYPPWNTENYNGYDLDSIEQFENDPDAQRKITYPNIYGFKTPGKHWFKMVDGDYRCQSRWKRIELGSACGNWMIMKDDYLHPGGQWANPKITNPSTVPDECLDITELLNTNVQGVEDADGNFSGQQVGDCLNNPKGENCRTIESDDPQCANPYFKRVEEGRPYKGADTPQNNKMRLPQSGIQIQSRSGHQIIMDDSVEQPQGKKLRWQDEFNFGCTDKFNGKFLFRSATGHIMQMNDAEWKSRLRGEENGIKLQTAAGQSFTMYDHTLDGQIAGASREIKIKSTSNHELTFHDEDNEQASPERKEGGIPINKGKRAWIMLRSGYGLTLRMDDYFSQESIQQQAITLLAPRVGGSDPGVSPDSQAAETGAPVSSDCKQGHLFRMQLNEDDGGFIITSSGGYYVCSSVKDHINEVGREDCEANKLEMIYGNYITMCKKNFIMRSQNEIHIADKFIILGAGTDCPPPEDDDDLEQTGNAALDAARQAIADAQAGQTTEESGSDQPCFFPVVIAKCPRVCPFTGFVHWTEKSISERLIASGKQCESEEEQQQ